MFFSGLNNELHIATKVILEGVEKDVHILLVIFLFSVCHQQTSCLCLEVEPKMVMMTTLRELQGNVIYLRASVTAVLIDVGSECL